METTLIVILISAGVIQKICYLVKGDNWYDLFAWIFFISAFLIYQSSSLNEIKKVVTENQKILSKIIVIEE